VQILITYAHIDVGAFVYGRDDSIHVPRLQVCLLAGCWQWPTLFDDTDKTVRSIVCPTLEQFQLLLVEYRLLTDRQCRQYVLYCVYTALSHAMWRAAPATVEWLARIYYGSYSSVSGWPSAPTAINPLDDDENACPHASTVASSLTRIA